MLFMRMVFRLLGWARLTAFLSTLNFFSFWVCYYDLMVLDLGALYRISHRNDLTVEMVYPIAPLYYYHHLSILPAIASLPFSRLPATRNICSNVMPRSALSLGACTWL